MIRHMNNLESVLTYEGTPEMHTLVIGQALTEFRPPSADHRGESSLRNRREVFVRLFALRGAGTSRRFPWEGGGRAAGPGPAVGDGRGIRDRGRTVGFGL